MGQRGEELARVEVDSSGDWDLSPDGSRLVVLDNSGLRIVTLADGNARPLPVENWEGFQSVAWAADGQGLFVTAMFQEPYVMLFVTLEGEAEVLWRSKSQWVTTPRPSPDGRYLAFGVMTFEENVWLLEDFLPASASLSEDKEH